MKLDHQTVKDIAHLARLAIAEEHIPHFVDELSAILTMAETLTQVDTAGVTPMSHPQSATQRLREDAITESDNQNAFQSLAPAHHAGLYLVPPVIE